jgi:hypothetical protein
MKRLLLLTLLVLTACAPEQTSSAVQIPEAVLIGIGGLLVALFTAGFTYLFERTRIDLRHAAVPLSATLSVFIVGELQNWINVIPPIHDPTIQLVLTIAGILLAGFGTLRLISRRPATLLAQDTKEYPTHP